jgi:serine/threonine protein kinase
LLDFGLALARDNPHLTHSGFVIGTPAFMAPEQARGEPLDGRSDLFALGIILYLMTTGERPFEGVTAMAVMRNLELHYPTRVNVKCVDVPAPFSNLIMELLAKDRKDRPASAAAVADRLARSELVRPTHLPVAPPQTPSGPSQSPASGSGGWQVPYKHPGPSTSIIRVAFMIAITAIGLYLYFYYYVDNYGRLEIVPDVADAEVHIRQNGEVKFTSTTDRQFTLRPGTYELVLVKPRHGYRLSPSAVEIKRDRTEQIRVVRDLNSR